MKATTLFRITAFLFLLFAIGHTFGFLSFHPPTQEALAVRESMNTVHFEVGGRIFNYGGFYRGFGLSVTVALLFQSFMTWYLGSMARQGSPNVFPIALAILLQQLFGFVLAWIYFGIPAIVLSALACLLITAAILAARKQTLALA